MEMNLRRALTVILICAMIATTAFPGESRHSFAFSDKEFLLDGKPIQIISGEMHPARIPREYWRHRIQMAKAMGCNTIAAYIFWNYHESEPGVFNFETGNRDIVQFFRLIQQENMWVLISKYVGTLPEIPEAVPAMEVPEIHMEAFTSVWSNLPEGHRLDQRSQPGPLLGDRTSEAALLPRPMADQGQK
jgi:hypothetical protein